MSSFFCLTIRFLDPVPQFHGRGDDGTPEWPPSPLRVFQSLVSAAATRWRDNLFEDYARPALQLLASIQPSIVAPQVAAESFGYRMYVPNNSGDLMTAAWARGDTDTSMAKFRVEKDVRPTRLLVGSEEQGAVHYLYPIADAAEFAKHKPTLVTGARSVTHLGWGVDMVAGNASEVTEEEVAKLAKLGERWQPTPDGSGTPLRVPRKDTLAALMDKHAAFLNRLDGSGFKPVPPLTAFNVVGYRRATDVTDRPVAVFELHRTVEELAELPAGKSRFRPFDPVRTPKFARTGGDRDPCGTVVVAGLVRHAVGEVAKEQGWPEERIKTFVQGHGDEKDGQATTDDRLMFLPLPSLTPLKVTDIRRVLVVGPPGENLTRLWQLLNGRELISKGDGKAVAMLAVGSRTEVDRYLRESRVWSTVTPVVLPGYDDASGVRRRLSIREAGAARLEHQKDGGVAKQWEALNRSVRDLLLKAFAHAGIGPGLLSAEQLDSGAAELEWRETGFAAGVDLARRYTLDAPRFPRYHVRVRFPHPVRGPLAIGAGRYRGLGLFAAE